MTPLLILVPVLGIGAYLLLSRQTQYAPPPGAPAVGSGGVRFQSYMQQLNEAMLAYRAAKAFGSGAAEVGQTTKGTFDIVAGMAAADQIRGTITASDLAQINNQVTAFKREIG
jgi:hypothetical protein